MDAKPSLAIASALAAVLAAAAVAPTGAAEKSLPSEELMRAIVNEVSGEVAFGYTARKG